MHAAPARAHLDGLGLPLERRVGGPYAQHVHDDHRRVEADVLVAVVEQGRDRAGQLRRGCPPQRAQVLRSILQDRGQLLEALDQRVLALGARQPLAQRRDALRGRALVKVVVIHPHPLTARAYCDLLLLEQRSDEWRVEE